MKARASLSEFSGLVHGVFSGVQYTPYFEKTKKRPFRAPKRVRQAPGCPPEGRSRPSQQRLGGCQFRKRGWVTRVALFVCAPGMGVGLYWDSELAWDRRARAAGAILVRVDNAWFTISIHLSPLAEDPRTANRVAKGKNRGCGPFWIAFALPDN